MNHTACTTAAPGGRHGGGGGVFFLLDPGGHQGLRLGGHKSVLTEIRTRPWFKHYFIFSTMIPGGKVPSIHIKLGEAFGTMVSVFRPIVIGPPIRAQSSPGSLPN